MKRNLISVSLCITLSILCACSKPKTEEIAPQTENVTVITNLPVPIQDQKTKLFYFVNNDNERLSKKRYILAGHFKPVSILNNKNDSIIRIDTLALVQIETQKKSRHRSAIREWFLIDKYEDISSIDVK